MVKIDDYRYNANEGCFIVRKSDDFIMGESICLGDADSIDNYDDVEYTEESYEDASTWSTYYSVEEAIAAAKELARELSNSAEVYNIYVMAGEYETSSGDVFGDPEAIYSISSADVNRTKTSRKNAGYTRHDVDDYISEAVSRTLRKYIR